MAIPLDNARLLEHHSRTRRVQEGLLVAGGIQHRLLPRGTLPVPGFDIHGVSVACEVSAGDFIDCFPMGEGGVGLVVGNVAGHGIAAANMISTVRTRLRALLNETSDPAVVLGKLNDFVVEDLEPGRFMTLFLARLDVPGRSFSGIRAGHNAPLLFRRGSDSFEELEGPGVALGMVKGSRYGESGPVPIGPGDVLYLFTDGIEESRGMDGWRFGTKRVAEVIRRHRDRSSREICAAILKEVGSFRGDGPSEDDLTVVVVRGL